MRLKHSAVRTSMVMATLLIGAHAASAQQPAAPPPAQQPAAPPPPREFNGDGGIILLYVEPDKTAQFEGAMQKVKEGLLKSEKPERKEQAASWKLYKAGAGAAGQVYVMVIAPSVKKVDYAIGAILGETQPQEARAIYDAYAGSLAKQPQVVIPMDLVNDFGK
jgi:hypothetical protein